MFDIIISAIIAALVTGLAAYGFVAYNKIIKLKKSEETKTDKDKYER